MLYLIILIIQLFSFGVTANNDCPPIPDDPSTCSQSMVQGLAVFNLVPYNTNNIKYYVITPCSYPNFVNPNGEPVNWTTCGCEGKQILVSCHGWKESALQRWSIDLLRTFVVQYGGCAIAPDYSGASQNLNYFQVVGNTQSIAGVIANYISAKICNGNTNCSQQLQLHGHSWGAHVCGVAGYNLGNSGKKPWRMIASDASGPYFNLLPDNDGSGRMCPESACIVINVKTSQRYGCSRPAWAHQTQYIGLTCGSNQQGCSGKVLVAHESCDHYSSVFMIKSTMNKLFPLIVLPQCFSNCKPTLSNVTDYLGWQSQGKLGIFAISSLPVCLNVTLDCAT